MEESILSSFLNEGFAIAVCVFLLYERSRTNDKFLASLDQVSLTVEEIKESIKDIRK